MFILLALRDLPRLSSVSHKLSWHSKTFHHSFSLLPSPPLPCVFGRVHRCECSCPHSLEEGVASPQSRSYRHLWTAPCESWQWTRSSARAARAFNSPTAPLLQLSSLCLWFASASELSSVLIQPQVWLFLSEPLNFSEFHSLVKWVPGALVGVSREIKTRGIIRGHGRAGCPTPC